MPDSKIFYTNGKTFKNIDLPQYPDSAWDWITEAPQDMKDVDLYSRVSAVYRAVNITASAVANMPFALMRGDNDVDTSDDWQNIVGFMPRPRELIRLWRLSLFMTNSAYGFMEGNRAIKNLRYILPGSITPVVDKWDGLKGFKRKVGTDTVEYSLKDNRIFYIWRLDHTTELLPSSHTEFKALMAAAGVLYYADYFVQNFFQRGGIKPTMLMVKGVANPQEREKIEGIWDKLIHGWSKYLGKIFNADAIEPHVIGEGIDNLKDSSLHKSKIEDIALAAGIPLSIMLANSANYSTARVEYVSWFRDSIMPYAYFMQETMNEQLFEPYGYKFEFRPEMSETGQEEEAERAGAYRAYVVSGMKPSLAARVVGIDMPAGFEYEDLDEIFVLPEAQVTETSEVEPVEAEAEAENANVVTPEKSVPTTLTIEQLREMELWQSIAYRKMKRGESLSFPFVCKSIPETIGAQIREQLPHCKSVEDIERVFRLEYRDDDAIKALADAINLAVEKMEILDA